VRQSTVCAETQQLRRTVGDAAHGTTMRVLSSSPAPAVPDSSLHRRDLFAQETLALVEWEGRDDAAVARLSGAMMSTLRREIALLAQVRDRGQIDALWTALHMIRSQGDAINLQVFSESTQAAMRKALQAQRATLDDEAQGRLLADEVGRALDEILTTFETSTY